MTAEGLSEEELEEMRQEHGVQPFEQGEWLALPMHVKCKSCGSEFDTGPADGREDWMDESPPQG